jgi:predicted ATPase
VIPLSRFERNGFSFQLSSPPTTSRTRFVVVIGPNGAGKSRLLGELAEEATSDSRAEFDQHRVKDGPTLALSNLISDPFTRSRASGQTFRYLGVRTRAGNSTSTGSLRSITIDAYLSCLRDNWRIGAVREAMSVAGVDSFGIRAKPRPERVESPQGGPLSRLEAPDARRLIGDLQSLGDELMPEGFGSVDWTTFLTQARGLTLKHDFSDEEGLALAWRYALPRPDLTLNIEGHIHDIGDLSVGQILLISLIARVAANVEEGSLVLIDEPEVGLHPTWQSEVVPLLRHAIPTNFGAQVFVATHSPHLVADADAVLIPGARWGEFKQFDGEVTGRSVENLLYRVFEARVNGNRMVEEDLATITKYVAGTDRADVEEADRAAERLRRIAGSDTPVVNSLLSSYTDSRSR